MADSLSSLGGGLEDHSMAVTSKPEPAWVLLAKQDDRTRLCRVYPTSLSCLSLFYLVVYLLTESCLSRARARACSFSSFACTTACFGPASCLNEVRSESNRPHGRLVRFSGNKRVRDTRSRFLILRISRDAPRTDEK